MAKEFQKDRELVELCKDSGELSRQLDEIELERKPTERATKAGLKKLYEVLGLKGNETILEVGCGKGYFRSCWPNHNRLWLQTDGIKEVLDEAKKRYPDGKYAVASAYNLPCHSNSIDIVCGYGSYDMLFDLERGLREAYRVLKDKGLFLCLLDLIPNPKAMLEYARTLPGFFRAFQRPGSDELRIEGFIFLHNGQEVRIHSNDLFAERLRKAMDAVFDPKSVKLGALDGFYDGPRMPYHDEKIVYRREFGYNNTKDLIEPEHPQAKMARELGMVVEMSTMLYALARK